MAFRAWINSLFDSYAYVPVWHLEPGGLCPVDSDSRRILPGCICFDNLLWSRSLLHIPTLQISGSLIAVPYRDPNRHTLFWYGHTVTTLPAPATMTSPFYKIYNYLDPCVGAMAPGNPSFLQTMFASSLSHSSSHTGKYIIIFLINNSLFFIFNFMF